METTANVLKRVFTTWISEYRCPECQKWIRLNTEGCEHIVIHKDWSIDMSNYLNYKK